ncbi:hypothetical protein AAG906_029367 [Vitis piasezkii]
MYPFTSLFLIVYCFRLRFCFIERFIVRTLSVTFYAHPWRDAGTIEGVEEGVHVSVDSRFAECYLDCVGSGGGHCPGCKEPYKECALCWTEVVTGSVTFNSPRGSRGLIQMIEHMNKSYHCSISLTSTSLVVANSVSINQFFFEISRLQACGLSRDYQLAKDLGELSRIEQFCRPFRSCQATVSSGPLKVNIGTFCHKYNMLSLLRSMHVLIILEEDASFLRYGYLSPDNAVGIRKEVTILCSELRPHALALVSSFGIPDAFLSRIAFNWIDANSWSLVQPQQGATVPL